MKIKVLFVLVFTILLASIAFAEVKRSNKTGAFPETYRNEVYLRTGQAGCLSCHDNNLREMSQRAGPIQHAMADMGRAYGKEIDVIYCINCHTVPAGGLGPKMGTALHGSHTPERGFTGDCWSCHIVRPEDGVISLWDREKYNPSVASSWWTIISDDGPNYDTPMVTVREWLTLRKNYEGYRDGFTMDAVFNAKISANQNKMSDQEDQYVAQNYGKPEEFLPKNMSNYTITLTGPGVTKPKTYTIADLKKFKQEKLTLVRQCAINPAGGAMIYQTEYEGVPILELLKDAGVKPNANYLKMYAYDGWMNPVNMKTDWFKKSQVSLKLRGKDLPEHFGGPVMYSLPGEIGSASTMWLKTIEVSEQDYDIVVPDEEISPIPGAMQMVNSGFFTPAVDGTVFGRKAKFEGWAFAWQGIKPSRLQFSADDGKTWHNFDLPLNTDPYKWVNWTLEWDAPKAGTYLIKVRAVADSHKLAQEVVTNAIVVIK